MYETQIQYELPHPSELIGITTPQTEIYRNPFVDNLEENIGYNCEWRNWQKGGKSDYNPDNEGAVYRGLRKGLGIKKPKKDRFQSAPRPKTKKKK